jgi:Tol biopolymer transport system component
MMRTSRSLYSAVTFSVLLVAPFALHAQQRAQGHIALEQYLDWEEVQAPQLSPDGTQIVYTRRWVDKMNDKWESAVWLMNTDGSHARQLVQGSDVKWSPDGKRIAYVAKGEPNGSQIFVRWMDTEGASTQVSHVTEAPSALEWSPDGKSIAFMMNVPIKETWRIAMPTPPKGAKWIESPKIVSRLNYRSDRIGFTDEAVRHIFVIPADGGTPRQITTGEWNASAPNFSPDGKWIAFSSLRTKDAESAFRKSHIYAANLETGEIKQITSRNGTSNGPEFSPDGKLISFIAADSVDHSAWAESKLYVMNADGSNAHVVSGNIDRPISGVMWTNDGSLYFNAESEGSKNLYVTSTAGQFRPVTSGKHLLTVTAVGKNGPRGGHALDADEA